MTAKRKPTRPSEAIAGVLLLGIGILLFVHSFDAKYEGMGIGAEFGPVFYPRVLLVLWILMAGILTIQALRRTWTVPVQDWPMIAKVMAVVSVSTLLMEVIGFLLAAILFCTAYTWVTGYRRPVGLILVGLIFPVVVWYLFENVLLITLPANPWLEWM